jgi:hypothetical protein
MGNIKLTSEQIREIQEKLSPKLLQSAISGVLSKDELIQQNTNMWNAGIQFLINWYLNQPKMGKNPVFSGEILDDAPEPWIEEKKYPQFVTEIKRARDTVDMIFIEQAALLNKFAIDHLAKIVDTHKNIVKIFDDKNVPLTDDHKARIWAGLSNTGSFHHFPIDEPFSYTDPVISNDFTADIEDETERNELHEHARNYHRNIAGSVASVLFETPKPTPVHHEIFSNTCDVASTLVSQVLQMEVDLRKKIKGLRANLAVASQNDESVLLHFDNTFKSRPNPFSSPLTMSPHFSSELDSRIETLTTQSSSYKNSPPVKESDWRKLLDSKQRIPTFSHEQDQALQALAGKYGFKV